MKEAYLRTDTYTGYFWNQKCKETYEKVKILSRRRLQKESVDETFLYKTFLIEKADGTIEEAGEGRVFEIIE